MVQDNGLVAEREISGDAPGGVTGHTALSKAAYAESADALREHQTGCDAFHVEGREVHWRRAGRMSDSEFSGAALERLLDGPATIRKRDTLEKMLGLLA